MRQSAPYPEETATTRAVTRDHRRHVAEQLARLRDCFDLIDGKVASYERHLAAGGSGETWQSGEPRQRPR